MRLFRVARAAVTSPRSGVIFGGSRKARPPPQPPKINFIGELQA